MFRKINCAVVVAAALLVGAQAAQADLVNAGFEAGTFSNWSTFGRTSIETASIGTAPSAGTYLASLNSFNPGTTAAAVESFLGLTRGQLSSISTGTPTEGSAIMQTIKVEAGDSLSFDWNFLTNSTAPGGEFNDFGFVSIVDGSSKVVVLADTFSADLGVSGTAFEQETGFNTFTHTFEFGGTYMIGMGVMDVKNVDDKLFSELLIDNSTITHAPAPGALLLGLMGLGIVSWWRGRIG